jgi:ATP adenylyltransferase
MEELWTPWRMSYIVDAKRTDECIFCRKPGDPEHDRLVLQRGRTTFTILNLYPYTTGHLMIVPYRHLPRFAALREDERKEIGDGLRRAERILRRVLAAGFFHAGINLGRAAGAGVDGHLHVHLVPRGLPAACGGPETELRAEELPIGVDEIHERLRPVFDAEP